ncbi:hypothetical protein DL764_010902 [Monosporascus ibericus]|uniref:Mannan endo-1,6-alpha-mannosidase n=1 Tax=Monosporascus ibericus TaxID=155417 RepID=A0A4Q4SRU9_9PEZI|nr:hypothetical protein DL764_010902 [Monosporascus ibericus]
MVSPSLIRGLASRAVFLISSQVNFKPQTEYQANTLAAIETLQGWYNRASGLWDTTGWWNSANVLTALADFAALHPAASRELGLAEMMQNTYMQAQKTTVQATKILSFTGLPTSTYFRVPKLGISQRGFDDFLNDFYDDEGWWALALIRAHDLGVLGLGDDRYLPQAEEIFEDMKKGNSTCGGIYWSKKVKYTNAIANELYLSTAASLANRVPEKKDYYLDIALAQWDWFKNSGMINKDNLINDGLTDDCENNRLQTWTYNQGVILGALVELSTATGDLSLLDEATKIAIAAITHLSEDGVLYEGCEPRCGADGAQFKGIFMRNLHYLQKAKPSEPIKNFILRNADAIWAKDRSERNELGITWNGPYVNATAGTHSSALDVLVGAIAVSSPV